MDCCNPMTGQCTQGDDCCVRASCAPEGATPHQRAMNAAIVKYTAPDFGLTMHEPWYRRVPPLQAFVAIGSVTGFVIGAVRYFSNN